MTPRDPSRSMSQPPVYHDPDLRLDCYTLLPHPAAPRLLLVRRESGWSLPRFQPREHHFAMVGHLNEAVRRRFGLETTVLRLVSHEADPAGGRAQRVYALECGVRSAECGIA